LSALGPEPIHLKKSPLSVIFSDGFSFVDAVAALQNSSAATKQ